CSLLLLFFFFSSRRRHTRSKRDWSSDVCSSDLSPGEPTQGAGAVAMLVGADPRLVEIEPISGLNSADVDDFWRPNDSSTAIVDGALSVSAYLDALTGAWEDL